MFPSVRPPPRQVYCCDDRDREALEASLCPLTRTSVDVGMMEGACKGTSSVVQKRYSVVWYGEGTAVLYDEGRSLCFLVSMDVSLATRAFAVKSSPIVGMDRT